MKRHPRLHTNPLRMTALVARERPIELPAGPTVEVELGCGDAEFLIGRAEELPDRLFVGIDIRAVFLAPARRRVGRLGLDNILLEPANLIVDAGLLFTPRRVHRFYINFPDPWFKRRQQNRRWLSTETIGALVCALEPRGQIFFQSDDWSSALGALALLEAHPALENAGGEWSFLRENPFGNPTSREQRCLARGLRIWRLLFTRFERFDLEDCGQPRAKARWAAGLDGDLYDDEEDDPYD